MDHKISILALIETICAILISVAIGFASDSLLYLAIAACIAPLLLLRSPESVELGKRLFPKGLPKSTIPEGSFFAEIITHLRIVVWSLIVRFISCARFPIKGVRSLPSNWARVVFVTNMRTPIEAVPECGKVSEILQAIMEDPLEADFGARAGAFLLYIFLLLGAYFTKALFSESVAASIIGNIVIYFTVVCLLLILPSLFSFIVPFLYRWSLKSTSLLWLPLIYIVHTTFYDKLDINSKLVEINSSALSRLVRIISWLTLVLFCAKLFVLPNVLGWWNEAQWTKLLNVYVMPNIIHPWHIAVAVNAALTLFLYYFFFERAPRMLAGKYWTINAIDNTIKVFTLVRGCISFYTITVAIYLAFMASMTLSWPGFETNMFPWASQQRSEPNN